MAHIPEHSDADTIDQLVVSCLDGVARQLDAAGLTERVCRSALPGQTAASATHSETALRPSNATRPAVRSSRSRAVVWLLGTATALVLAFLGGRWMSPSTADAATALREVQSVHGAAVDRCYHVHFSPDPEFSKPGNPLTGPSDTVLWTRGDQFWADATLGHVKLVYGRDESGKLWVSPSRSTGIRLASQDGQLPEEIAMYCAINSMTVPALVERVLSDFDLRTDLSAGRSSGPVTAPDLAGHADVLIWATLKSGRTHPLVSQAMLEIDDSNTLVRLILWTLDDGQPRGTVTFTLIETSHTGDEQYQLETHLDSDARVRVHQLDAAAQNKSE